MNLDKIIDDAYQLYMPQVRSEITKLSQFVADQMRHRIEDVSMGRGEMSFPIPFNVLEIGTKFGGTFYIWNKLVQNHGAGQCISIDMSDGGLHGGISESEMDQRDLWFGERFDNCHFIRGDSHHNYTQYLLAEKILFPETPKLYSDIKRNGSLIVPENAIDFLFIDGDHTFHGVEQDWEMYSSLVKKGGVIAFHDIIISKQHHERNVYVGEFWREMTKVRNSENPNQCIIDGNWYEVHKFIGSQEQTWAGIGVLIKL